MYTYLNCMKIIKIFASWTNCNTIYNKVMNEYDWNCDSKYGVDYIFTKENNYTHAILMNIIRPSLKINKENVIGLAQEPSLYLKFNINNNIIKYFKENVKKYFIGSVSFIENNKEIFIEKMSYQLPHISYKIVNNFIENYPKKNKLINFVYSWKNSNKPKLLYRYRHELGNTILKTNIPVDIYGSSTDTLKKTYPEKENIKYGFHWRDVHKVYENYKFCIVIENTREPEYISEKMIQLIQDKNKPNELLVYAKKLRDLLTANDRTFKENIKNVIEAKLNV